MATASLLIADDNAERAHALVDRIKSDLWTVTVAPTAQGAKEALDANPLALVLADASMWHDGGLAAYASQKHPALPVIVLTAKGEASPVLVQHLQLGAMTYIPRDAGRRRLVETIQSILEITRRNPYRERVKSLLRWGEVELQVGNDPADIAVIVGYMLRLLEDYGLSNEKERFRVGLALSEALSNAMIHGNLEVPSALREEGSDAYYEMMDRQRGIEPFASRIVVVKSRFSEASVNFVIRDQGKGFDRAALPDPEDPESIMKASGRGILLMKAYTDLVTWNEAGNEVTLVKSLTGEKK